jgi:WD40 repeat protein
VVLLLLGAQGAVELARRTVGHHVDAVGVDLGSDAVIYSPTGSLLAAAGSSGQILIWDTATGARKWTLNDGDLTTAIAFSDDGTTVTEGDLAGRVAVWDTATSTQKAVTEAGSTVYGVAFSPDDKTLAVGDAAGQVLIVDLHTGAQLALPVGNTVYSVTFASRTGTLAVADGGGTAVLYQPQIWSPDLRAVKAALCAEVGGANLTPSQWATYVTGQPYRLLCP